MYSETGIETEDDLLLKREGIRRLMFSVSVPLVKIGGALKALIKFVSQGGI
ncbi:MAG: hypothetical protein M0Z48_00520 [Nitrospiraceae bacterium]|nr:hypothetical protein [Nitrospiraceae bacterium]